jgi:hypothetical protein
MANLNSTDNSISSQGNDADPDGTLEEEDAEIAI